MMRDKLLVTIALLVAVVVQLHLNWVFNAFWLRLAFRWL